MSVDAEGADGRGSEAAVPGIDATALQQLWRAWRSRSGFEIWGTSWLFVGFAGGQSLPSSDFTSTIGLQ
jgi:hypothetical protein